MSIFRSKFVTTYEKLLSGLTPGEIHTQKDGDFWADLLGLDVESSWLDERLRRLSKEQVLGHLKPFISALFSACLVHLHYSETEDSRQENALVTLIIVIRATLPKNLAGWEVMEVLGGGVSQSDSVFSEFVNTIYDIISNNNAPVSLRHRTLQLALVFVCGIDQLSPGAYMLSRDLFPALVEIITNPETQRFTFEATLLLSLLSNFHKSDAANLNPYLRQIKSSVDGLLMRRICWAAGYAMETAIKAYQAVENDSPPTLKSSIESLVSSLRPDRALSSTPLDIHKEEFKSQPIEASVILLPLFEYMHHNQFFRSVFLESLVIPSSTESTPLPHALLSLSSYILTHASSSSNPRSLAYASLSLNILMVCVEHTEIIRKFTQAGSKDVRLCRQRLPLLPLSSSPRPPLCPLLDCCVLWLRHNLQKKLEVASFIKCIWVIEHTIWFLTYTTMGTAYHWEEVWRSLISLSEFLVNKIESLRNLSRLQELAQEVIVCLHMALVFSEAFLASPNAVYQLVYELVRSSAILAKQRSLLKSLEPFASSSTSRVQTLNNRAANALIALENTVTYYEGKLAMGTRTAREVMKTLSSNIDKDGVWADPRKFEVEQPVQHSDEAANSGFVRWACQDGMALMPVG